MGNEAYEARRCGNCGKANRVAGYVNCAKCMREAEKKARVKDDGVKILVETLQRLGKSPAFIEQQVKNYFDEYSKGPSQKRAKDRSRLHRALDVVLDRKVAKDDAYIEGFCGRCGRKREECERLRLKYGKRCVEIPVSAKDSQNIYKGWTITVEPDLVKADKPGKQALSASSVGALRVKIDGIEARAKDADGPWKCVVCGERNVAAAKECKGCGNKYRASREQLKSTKDGAKSGGGLIKYRGWSYDPPSYDGDFCVVYNSAGKIAGQTASEQQAKAYIVKHLDGKAVKDSALPAKV